ncbi:hypothetical protein [Planctomyces sp. SH-PL62]|uniref:hypothetical protein n=1 Tax=Planctomyces sp. SH-PL62 TaxID=1636152 RepID=UPI00078CE994|nr:hypothetical protein [Planctomyces sp. SH-PL62]AMV40695.1 hypothetical protein VT85_24905 [Planctomyces sp. SH-PL62]
MSGQRMARKYGNAEAGLFVGVWLALMTFGRSRLFQDPGTFWHTVMGRKMWSSGRLIEADPFSYTFGGTPWTPYEWLAECAMAAVHGFSEFDGLLLATATTLAGLYTWTAHRLMRSGLHWLPTTLFLTLTIAVSCSHFLVRPHIASIVFLGLTFAFLCDFEAGRIGLGRLFWLIPLFIIWTNWHGAVLGGLAILGLAALGWSLAWGFHLESPVVRPRQAGVLGVLVFGCGLTILVNPYGLEVPRTWLKIMRSPVVPRLIVEHAPPNPGEVSFWMILALGLVYLISLPGTRPHRPRVTWLIPIVWFVLTLSRIRHAPLFAIVTALAFADMLPYSRLATWLAKPGRDLYQPPESTSKPTWPRDWRPALLPALMILSSVAFQASDARVPILGRGWARLDPAYWPVELLPELRRCERRYPLGSRIFNDYTLGGFLIYFTPGLKVFMDDRCEVYGDTWLERFARADSDEPELMDEWLEEYRIDDVFVLSGSGFDRHIAGRPGWSLVGRSPAANLYHRDQPLSSGRSAWEGGRGQGATAQRRGATLPPPKSPAGAGASLSQSTPTR